LFLIFSTPSPEIHAIGIDDLTAMEIATREMLLDPILPTKA
jgi:hypothetical protein